MADAIGIALGNQFIFEQMQGPAGFAFRRSRADSGDKEGFRLAMEHTGFAVLLLFMKQRRFQSALSKAAAHLLDHYGADPDLLADVGVSAGTLLASGICKQQNMGTFPLSVGMFIRAGDNFGFQAQFWRQGYMM